MLERDADGAAPVPDVAAGVDRPGVDAVRLEHAGDEVDELALAGRADVDRGAAVAEAGERRADVEAHPAAGRRGEQVVEREQRVPLRRGRLDGLAARHARDDGVRAEPRPVPVVGLDPLVDRAPDLRVQRLGGLDRPGDPDRLEPHAGA